MSVYDLMASESSRADQNGIPVENVAKQMVEKNDEIITRFMTEQEKKIKTSMDCYKQAASALFDASNKMRADADEAAKNGKALVSKVKDMANQMTDSMNRVTKILGSDFESRITQLERLADAMERLQSMQKDGSLQEVIKALTK